ncbi:hypothetical protein [Nodularia spumigena]|uniref:hypothetical protein n=1 Tax=Nodularia spumigena TaxID=70799 RepID=UPI002B217306|nr:hypothetical protein [Nodularia spumigena]MEA5612419.1 hypothetical protein [Nodularia spumigena UHCC 0040]
MPARSTAKVGRAFQWFHDIDRWSAGVAESWQSGGECWGDHPIRTRGSWRPIGFRTLWREAGSGRSAQAAVSGKKARFAGSTPGCRGRMKSEVGVLGRGPGPAHAVGGAEPEVVVWMREPATRTSRRIRRRICRPTLAPR